MLHVVPTQGPPNYSCRRQPFSTQSNARNPAPAPHRLKSPGMALLLAALELTTIVTVMKNILVIITFLLLLLDFPKSAAMGQRGVIQHGASALGCASCTAAAVAPHDQSTAPMLESDYGWHIRISGDQWIPPKHPKTSTSFCNWLPQKRYLYLREASYKASRVSSSLRALLCLCRGIHPPRSSSRHGGAKYQCSQRAHSIRMCYSRVASRYELLM